ncbi:MAG: class I SAM-dependent methyltransferase [Kofleriaceae bacterium]
MKTMTADEYRAWVQAEEWYQTIELSNGLVTRGSVDSRARIGLLEKHLDVRGKRVIDIGCNSGAYCFWAKRQGAREVVGVDIFEKRIVQARTLAAHEGLDVSFETRGVTDLAELGTFDVVMCFAVLTEVPDLLGALNGIKRAIGSVGLLELSLAKPIAYVSRSRNFLRGYRGISRRKAVLELREHKHGWMIDPSLEVVETVLGPEFRVQDLGQSVRYQMLKIERTRST